MCLGIQMKINKFIAVSQSLFTQQIKHWLDQAPFSCTTMSVHAVGTQSLSGSFSSGQYNDKKKNVTLQNTLFIIVSSKRVVTILNLLKCHFSKYGK